MRAIAAGAKTVLILGFLVVLCACWSPYPPTTSGTTLQLIGVGPSVSSCGLNGIIPVPTPGNPHTYISTSVLGTSLLGTGVGTIALLIQHDPGNPLSITDSLNGAPAVTIPAVPITASPPSTGEFYQEYIIIAYPPPGGESPTAGGFYSTVVINTGYPPSGLLHTYTITEQYASLPITVNVIFDAPDNVIFGENNAPAGSSVPCQGTMPGPPQQVSATVTTANNFSPATFLQWNPVWWTNVDANGNPISCSQSDTYFVEISTDPGFANGPSGNGLLQQELYGWDESLDITTFGTPASGTPNTGQAPVVYSLPPTTCQRSSNSYVPQLASGGFPISVPWGQTTSPDASTDNPQLASTGNGSNPGPLYFRVMAGYYGNTGPWSQAAQFQISPPLQFAHNGAAPSLCQSAGNSGGSACLAWLPMAEPVVSYDVRFRPDTGVPLSYSNSTLVTVQSSDPSGEPQCAPPSSASFPFWCGLVSGSSYPGPLGAGGQIAFNPKSGDKVRWDVRARYPGQVVGPAGDHVGPWSPDFQTTWQ